jgi:hypothetical protein
VRRELNDDVSEIPVGPHFHLADDGKVKMGPTGISETSSVNSRGTSCNYPKTKKQNV